MFKIKMEDLRRMNNIAKRLHLWQKVLIGMLLGIFVGHFAGNYASMFQPIGTVFITLIKMVVVPLIFFSILNGVASVSDADTFSRIGTKSMIAYSGTTIFAVIVGLLFAHIFQPGVGIKVPMDSVSHSQNVQDISGIVQLLLGLIPSNPFKAMVEGNTVQVVVFAFFTGFALISIGDRGQPVKDFVASATQLVFKMIELVIKLTPYGVFGLMSHTVGQYGIEVLFSLGWFVLTVVSALFAQYIFFGVIILVFARLNPMPFYKKMIDTQAVAFATISSKATLPTAMKEMVNKVGVSKQSASFILPLGASMNMDGVAIYLGICSVFFAQMYGIELSWIQYGLIILTSTIGSIGAAGFPGGSMVMMGMVLSSVGLPIDGIALILGVDRFLEMIRTIINITGDCTVTLVVDVWEQNLNRRAYYSEDEEDEDSATE